jgi:NRPS condensation-like uncharacterized protein
MPTSKVIRPLDPGEAFFTLADQVSGMNFVVFAERTGALPPERVRSALELVQQENLLLQTRIQWVDEEGLCFVHAPGVPIEVRCLEVSEANWQNPIEQQLSEPFEVGSAPLMRCLVVNVPTASHANGPQQSPVRSVLALCFHHAVADGRSGTALLCRLLNLIAGDKQMPVAQAPAAMPAMLDLHPARYRWAEQPDAAKQLKATLIGDYCRHGPLAQIPWLAPEARRREPKFIRLTFAPDVTSALIATARAQGSSLHGALCAAQLLAQLALQQRDESSVFCLSSPVDMRPHLEPAPTITPSGLYVSIVSSTFAVNANTAFWELAREVITQTRLQLSRGEGHLFFNMFGLDGSQLTSERVAPFHHKLLSSLPNTMVSNVGTIAAVVDDPAVTAVSFALCPMPYQTLFTAASTYQGQLILNVGSDAARLSDAHAQVLAQCIKNNLINAVAKPATFIQECCCIH